MSSSHKCIHCRLNAVHQNIDNPSTIVCNKHLVSPLFVAPKKYKSLNLTELKSLLPQLTIKTKKDYIQYIQTNGFIPFVKKKNKEAKEIPLIDIAPILHDKMTELFPNSQHINKILFENQLGQNAVRMMCIQNMLIQYFVSFHRNYGELKNISAKKKLSKCTKEQTVDYDTRKKTSVDVCLEYLNTHNSNDNRYSAYVEYISSLKKKDDMTDAFMQGLRYIETNLL
jgi:hypothetical protein